MVLITGANGFIGSQLVSEYNLRGEEDLILVDSVPLSVRNLVQERKYKEFIPSENLESWFKSNKSRLQWIIHLGACSSTTETDWEFLKKNNLEYSQMIWNWSTQSHINLIYASSAATYGDGRLGFDDKTSPEKLKALNLYGESKAQFDIWTLKQNKAPHHWYGLKFFNVYGPNESHKGQQSSVVLKAFNQISENNKLGLFKSNHPDFADGEQKRDFVYVKDVVRWMYELTHKKAESGIYNMGSGKARTWLDLARGVFGSLGKEVQIEWLEIPDNIKNQYQNFTEAKMEKWLSQGLSRPQWSLELGVEDYVKNFLLKESHGKQRQDNRDSGSPQ